MTIVEKVTPERQGTVEKEIPPFLVESQSLGTIEFAEQKRDTLRAEAMVNLAIGMTLVQIGDIRQIVITEDMLEQFAARYRVVTSDTPAGVLLEVIEKGNTMSQISPSYVTGLEKYINELRNQVSSLKAELREICDAINDPASDLTLTTVECIKKLKAENEWQPIETAPKDKSNVVLLRQPCGSVANGYFLAEAYAGNGAWIWPYIHKTPTHWMPLPKPPAIDAAIAKG